SLRPSRARVLVLFQEAGGLVAVGTAIPSFDASLVDALEPNAPPPMARWEALDELFRASVPRFVSFSPTYPTMDRDEIREALSWFAAVDPDVVFHEPMNPRGANFEMCLEATRDAGYNGVAEELERIHDHGEWTKYAIEHIKLVREIAKKRFDRLHIHSWPDQQLIESASGEQKEWLKQLKQEVSPEPFAGHN
ncbi:radical SAM protein, partial [Haloarcula sp. AONF1]